jgi:hypothetical protein
LSNFTASSLEKDLVNSSMGDLVGSFKEDLVTSSVVQGLAGNSVEDSANSFAEGWGSSEELHFS